jgi:DNA-directed RNA polymerase specialized sigma24 family protein
VSDRAQSEVRALVDLYDRALEEVYGYLRHRCGDSNLAEDLTSDTFMAATRVVQEGKLFADTLDEHGGDALCGDEIGTR